MLAEDYGLNATGWTFRSATAISADGSTIVGWGDDPCGTRMGWIASRNDTGLRRRLQWGRHGKRSGHFRFSAAWFAGDHRAGLQRGADCLTVQDIFDFLAAWFAGCP